MKDISKALDNGYAAITKSLNSSTRTIAVEKAALKKKMKEADYRGKMMATAHSV